MQFLQSLIHPIENTSSILRGKASASPAEKEHADIDASIVVIRELQFHYAQGHWDAAALKWAELIRDFALMNEVLAIGFFHPFCDQRISM